MMMVERLSRRTRVKVVDLASGIEERGLFAKLRRLGRIGAAIPKLVSARLSGATAAYGSVDDGSGGWLTVIWVGTARLLGMRVFLHHHSFRYLLASSAPIATLARVAGPASEHVVLCSKMEALLRQRYSGVGTVRVVPNTVPLPEPIKPAPIDRPFTIGMLSNLTFEKGVGRFLNVVTALCESGSDIRAVLAGPAVGTDVEEAILAAQARLGERLDWRGRVTGESKEAFFEAIDLFVFPTRYETEAYPLVVVEALVRGVSVCTTDQGCLNEFASLASVTVLGRETSFEESAVALINTLAKETGERANHRQAARAEGVDLVAASQTELEALIDRICDAGS
ncbi:glycosyltransferase involved in cell wall biosynthesis [Erythrobacter lutimaris]|nr:glycosyltransferase involved in cell wall biosynthesis [Alteriqipengyuania lutimaris]